MQTRFTMDITRTFACMCILLFYTQFYFLSIFSAVTLQTESTNISGTIAVDKVDNEIILPTPTNFSTKEIESFGHNVVKAENNLSLGIVPGGPADQIVGEDKSHIHQFPRISTKHGRKRSSRADPNPGRADKSPTKRRSIVTVNALFLLPEDSSYLFSQSRMMPAVDIAVLYVTHFIINVTLVRRTGDTRCNSRHASIALFEHYRKNLVDVIFGPVCDYSLAPVARYAPFWNLPVITSGGLAHDFTEKRKPEAEYRTLTRTGPQLSSMSEYLLSLMNTFRWRSLIMIYDQSGRDNIMIKYCYLVASAVIHASKVKQLRNDFHIYLPNNHDIGKMLVDKVGLKNAET